jgi:hypothetical protein
MNPVGLPLSPSDIEALRTRWIDENTAESAELRRVDVHIGGELVGQPKLDCAGIAIPYFWPGSENVRDWRVRRDHPEIEIRADGSRALRRRYIGPPGRGNMLYCPRGAIAELLTDTRVPIVIGEGEFKTLALWRLAWHGLNEAGDSPSFLPIGLQGVWNWRGVIGKMTDATGSRVDVHGPIPDLARFGWAGRRVIVLFDADVSQKLDVQEARRQLTIELEFRGAEVAWFCWPKVTPAEQKGVDDLLAARGPEFVLGLLSKARPVNFKKKLYLLARLLRSMTGTLSLFEVPTAHRNRYLRMPLPRCAWRRTFAALWPSMSSMSVLLRLDLLHGTPRRTPGAMWMTSFSRNGFNVRESTWCGR